MREPTMEVVSRLLDSSDESLAELWVRPFEDDLEANDDSLQAQLEEAFGAAFDDAKASLESEFGPAVHSGDESEDAVPLEGVFRFAVWRIGDSDLWLAAAHEDREAPFLLLVGR